MRIILRTIKFKNIEYKALLGTSKNSFADQSALILCSSSLFKLANITNIRQFSHLFLLD